MNPKPVKTPPAASKEAKGKIKRELLVEEDLTNDAPDPAREGPNNLRQRAEWFRRRTAGEEAK